MAITTFDHKYNFLSNFHHCEVWFEGLKFKSSEAAFQAAKTLDIDIRKTFTQLEPNKAKQIGRKLKMRSDWENVKLKIMEEIVRDKFTRNIGLQEALLATDNQELIEGNWWGDTFWGVDIKSGEGKNMLGQMLMEIRTFLQKGENCLCQNLKK